MPARALRHEDYAVGWVCALPIELAAAKGMLDEEHEPLETEAHETNIYTLGRVGHHNVVIACMPKGQMGTTSAAAVTAQMMSTFTSIRIGLMVGIGGGVPSEADIRLGDVVVSQPCKTHGGVVQYDFGKDTPDGFERTGFLNAPPSVLLNALAHLTASQSKDSYHPPNFLSKLDPSFTRDRAGPDVLFQSHYQHRGGATCEGCSREATVNRCQRRREVVFHYGTIASGNRVMRDAAKRDEISAALGGVLCFEMEAAGLMNNFPCIVIRGICDYADSHKNKTWQPYAAATAAACAKELLSLIPRAEVRPAYMTNPTAIASGTYHPYSRWSQ